MPEFLALLALVIFVEIRLHFVLGVRRVAFNKAFDMHAAVLQKLRQNVSTIAKDDTVFDRIMYDLDQHSMIIEESMPSVVSMFFLVHGWSYDTLAAEFDNNISAKYAELNVKIDNMIRMIDYA